MRTGERESAFCAGGDACSSWSWNCVSSSRKSAVCLCFPEEGVSARFGPPGGERAKCFSYRRSSDGVCDARRGRLSSGEERLPRSWGSSTVGSPEPLVSPFPFLVRGGGRLMAASSGTLALAVGSCDCDFIGA